MHSISSDFWASPDYCPAAIHEFPIPPKALLGLHSYCPVYFDAFHAVLVDVSVHTTLLKTGSRKVHTKVPSIAYSTTNDVSGESIDGSTQALDQVASTDLKQVMLVKALLNANDTLLAELQKLCDATNHAIDLTKFISKMNDMNFCKNRLVLILKIQHKASQEMVFRSLLYVNEQCTLILIFVF
ncbi:uncharacterized protein [Gossypium hirsutum]|uniref:Uncharacterized protein n=1 Tax=Gossypium hirsutum TaxID=3635 RepID=A0ABM3A9W4_GOSHI|nr:uncharacterized protein LOC121218191 [Gossypium hirsutum]